ncbi:MAG: hypothetical protein QTN59_20370 [Candidatus Electrothrix communis]|nr:MAG: hypothetical protein QTN59_20370 [Candidatus Electrothrix communis]
MACKRKLFRVIADCSGTFCRSAGNDFKALRDLSSLMLSGVKVKYGRDSNEYEMAGGTRLSDINRHPHGGRKW